MPHVHVSLYAGLREYVRRAPTVDVEIAAGATVRKVLGELGVPPESARIIFVDSRHAGLDHALRGGEQLGVFPAIGGG